MRDPYVDLAAAAKAGRVTQRTVRRWVHDGLVKARRDPRDRRRLLVRLADVHRVAGA